MSIYYILINRTKHEYIYSGDFDFGLRDSAYRFRLASLLGHLLMNLYGGNNEIFNPQKDYGEDGFDFEGHWVGDDVELQDEYDSEWEEIWEYETYGSKYGTERWINISIPLRDHWNKEVEYWYDYDPELVKKLKI